MNIQTILDAKNVAKRFNDAANSLLLELNEQRKKAPGYDGNAPKQSGALRRASMDLSRALSAMRASK